MIAARLRSTPNTTFTLQFFSDPSPDPSGLGEGQQLLGTFTVTTNPAGIATFVITVPTKVPAGQIITATATDPNNNTSEFSSPVEVKEGVSSYDKYYSNGNVFHRTYWPDGSSTATLTDSNDNLLDDYSYNAQGQLTDYDTYYSNGNVYHRVYASDGSSTATLTTSGGTVLQTYNFNAQGQLTSIVYDSNGNVLTYTYSSGVVSSATLKASTANGGGVVLTYNYNSQGQLSSIVYGPASGPNNGNTLSYSYNTSGQVSQATLTNSSNVTLQTYNYSYNAQGQVASVSNGNNQVLYSSTYDSLGRVHTLSYGPGSGGSNGDVLTYTYHDDGTSSAALVSSSNAPIATYHYDVFGRVTEIDYANGNVYKRTYDPSTGTSTATLKDKNGKTIETYTYDAQGNLISHNP